MAYLLYPTNASLYFHNELASVLENADGYAHIDWNPVPVHSPALRAVAEQVLRLLSTAGFTKILSDHQLLSPLLLPDQRWLTEEWVPRAVVEVGLRHCAIVKDYDLIAHSNAAQIVQHLSAYPVTLRFFEEQSLATHWLHGV
ncbi:hypothetical protein GCM10022408_19600 [Hymenobacter fastidiosus]|uniref:STAS/SEC14 domain-containing protein n=1 Tax=Hymenobacter fastidiosus TaxID=486264 RepID=A0ABP7S741_9BACT